MCAGSDPLEYPLELVRGRGNGVGCFKRQNQRGQRCAGAVTKLHLLIIKDLRWLERLHCGYNRLHLVTNWLDCCLDGGESVLSGYIGYKVTLVDYQGFTICPAVTLRLQPVTF